MANTKKLTITTSKRSAIKITRSALKAKRLVYIGLANKTLKYKNGRSRIAYIGTTKNGAPRIASSAAKRAVFALKLHGVSELTFFVVTCAARQSVQTWRKLETGLILEFKALYGDQPLCNTHGKRQKWNDELEYFTAHRLASVIKKYS